MQQPDAGTGTGTTPRMCPLPMTSADAGALTATKTQLCNEPGSMGTAHWYRVAATLPGAPTDYIQIELYDKVGAFSGTTVHAGTFQVDTNPASCGVCVRALGDKAATTAKEYFATSGMVNVTTVGAAGTQFQATLSNVTFAELDATRKVMTNGCMATLAGAQLSGSIVQVGGTAGGGGGGGGSGGGGGACPTTIGD